MNQQTYPPCPICDENEWTHVYAGFIRDGDFLDVKQGKVMECRTCGVGHLQEAMTIEDYRDGTYLEKYPTADKSIQMRDEVDLMPWHEMNGKLFLDLGAGDMSLATRAVQSGAEVVAVDPCPSPSRDIKCYKSIDRIPRKLLGKFDYVSCFSVIEHADNPVELLEPIGRLLKDSGALFTSTPNHNDILIELLPDTYPRFFYRTAHKWYFDEPSLEACLQAAGLSPIKTFYMQRFGFNNLVGWLRDKEPPKGKLYIEGPYIEKMEWDWILHCENIHRSDYLFNVSRKLGAKEIN